MKSVYLVKIKDMVVCAYSNRAAARRHVELVRTTKPETLANLGIGPGQVWYERLAVHTKTQ